MLSNADIKRIVEATTEASREIFVTKEEFRTEFSEFRKDFNQLQTSVDNFAKKVSDHDTEIIIINHRLRTLENTKN